MTQFLEIIKSMSPTALIIDAAVVLIFLFFCLSGARKGLYNKFMPLIIIVLSFVGAIFLSRMFTSYATELVFPRVSDTVTRQIERFMNSFHLEGGEVSSLIKLALKNVDMSETAASISRIVTEKLVHAALFIICFIVLLIVLKLIKRLFRGVKDLPVIKPIDKLGGFILGGLEGLAVFYIVIKALDIAGSVYLRDLSVGTKLLSWLVNL